MLVVVRSVAFRCASHWRGCCRHRSCGRPSRVLHTRVVALRSRFTGAARQTKKGDHLFLPAAQRRSEYLRGEV